ncbi:MAG: heavy metal-associated domain-containing protein [Patescibacteria group bacterium]
MIKQTFKISGMHCTACALNIDLDLEEVSGVKNSQTNYAKQETTVEFDAAKISPEILKSTIAKTGYGVVD